MKKLLLDTNILIDLLARREPFYKEAAALFLKGERNSVLLSVSSLTMINTHYILRKQLKEQHVRGVLRDMRQIINVLPVDRKIIDLALDSSLLDYEDAIQYQSALEFGQEMIITRNLKHFKGCSIPVMTAGQFLALE